jgi:hypothetical protein
MIKFLAFRNRATDPTPAEPAPIEQSSPEPIAAAPIPAQPDYAAYDPFRQLFFDYYKIQYQQQTKNPSQDLHIPKIVHQIWLGDKEIPVEYAVTIEDNKRRFESQGIRFNLYTNKDVAAILGDDPVHIEVYNKIPSWDYACKKDWLMLLLLYRHGGVGLDCSVSMRDHFWDALLGYTYVLCYPDLGDHMRFAELPEQGIHYCVTFCYNMMACPPKSDLFKNLIDKFIAFELNENYKTLNAKYMDLKVYPDTSLRHGWMTQVHINEETAPHIAQCVKDNVASKQIRLTTTDLYIDIDNMPLAYYLKHFVLKKMTREQFDSFYG